VLDYETFEAITFDCYGTLIDWESGILSSLAPVFRRAGLDVEGELILEAYGAAETQIESGAYAPYKEVLAEVLRSLGGRFGFSPTAEEIVAFSRSPGSWPPFSDTVDALRLLEGKYALAILSNVDNDLFEGSRDKLEAKFDHVFTAEDIGSYKPDRRNFEYALKRLPVPKERVLHAAQSLFHDVEPATELGLRTVWINRRGGRVGSGATPPGAASPDAEFPDMISFARAAARGHDVR
jgi:2-haloacid dehalogenase